VFDPDDERKRIIESRWNDGHAGAPILCQTCGRPVIIFGRDENDNAIYDRTCARCTNLAGRPAAAVSVPPKPREHCGYCYDRKPLIGMRWCGECAIRINEMGRGTSPEYDKALDLRIAYFKKRMADVVSVGWIENPDMPEILDDLYQAFEDAEQRESARASGDSDLVRGPETSRPD